MATDPLHAVVVGGSDGIGLAVTRKLLDRGWRVAGLSRSPSPIRDLAYTHEVVDVTATHYPAALARSLDSLGRVDLCVYSVGTGARTGLADLPMQTRTIEVNLLGMARTVEAVVPRMVAARGGHIVGLSSYADVMFDAAAFGYPASKAGMSAYLSGLSLAVRRQGVRVTNVRFGLVDTKMGQSPVRPMLITADRAADVVLRTLRRRPAVVSYPRRMGVLVSLIRVGLALQLRLWRPRPNNAS